MKRDNTKYKNVILGDIYNHYGIFFWQECFFCSKEFRRERGYRFQLQGNRPWVYSCAGCSDSKENVDKNIAEVKSKRPKPPSAPPPRNP